MRDSVAQRPRDGGFALVCVTLGFSRGPTCPLQVCDSGTKEISQFRENSFKTDPEPGRNEVRLSQSE